MTAQSQENALQMDVWFDVVCPFSYMAERKLKLAIEQAGVPVNVTYHSFQLRPDLPLDTDVNFIEMFARRRNMSPAEAKQATGGAAAQAAQLGLEIRYDRARATNTRRAHQLVHFARAQGLEENMIERLFKAYFVDGLLVSDIPTLVNLAAEVGLDPEAVSQALSSALFEPEVETDVTTAARLGVNGVPFVLIDNSETLSGGQPPEVTAVTLRSLWKQRTH